MNIVLTSGSSEWSLNIIAKLAYRLRGDVCGVVIEDMTSFPKRLVMFSSRLKRYGLIKLADQILLSIYLLFKAKRMPTPLSDEEKSFFDGLKKIRVKSINDNEVLNYILSEDTDFLVNLATSYMEKSIFKAPKVAALNIHGGITPEYRGPNPILWAIYNGKVEDVGMTIHKISEKLDLGEILIQKRVPVLKGDTIDDIVIRACEQGIESVKDIVRQYKYCGELPVVKKDSKSRYYGWYGLSHYLKVQRWLRKRNTAL